MAVIGVFLALVVIVLIWFVVTYNGFVRLRNQVKNSWSQIDVQLKRRHDLIPNLVETARGYMQHERGTFEAVATARSAAAGARNIEEAAKAENALSQVLRQFMAVVENYPQLKANENFLALQEELTSTENKISFSRQFYNDTVLQYNNRVQMFPSNIVAGIYTFRPEVFFEMEDKAERAAPQVKF